MSGHELTPPPDEIDETEIAYQQRLAWESEQFVSTENSALEGWNKGERPSWGSGEVPVDRTSEVEGQDGRSYWVEEYQLDTTQGTLCQNLAVTLRDKVAAGAQFVGSVSLPTTARRQSPSFRPNNLRPRVFTISLGQSNCRAGPRGRITDLMGAQMYFMLDIWLFQ